ncbi:MAG: CehA/McbA family metallohydrolase [Candidatus Thermoplasmatota archaeon]|jgi:predicted metal-dependent phosphoesterase TrpH|nr:CehA/McbA family metallohydrolase [Candidatus Thermoplasmatota archaeon]
MLKLDLHIHSQYSEDASGSPKEIMDFLQKKGLDGMAITDHNSIKGSIEALKLKPKEFIIIPGIEISTLDGHILALNIKKEIQRELTVEETVEKILDEGGIPIVPHLFRKMSGIKEEKLKTIYTKVPAMEVFNGCSMPKTNIKTARVAKQYNLGGTGGSDAHDPLYAGYGYTIIDTTDNNVDSVLSFIEKKNTWGEGSTIPLRVRRDRMLKSIRQFFERGFKRI